MAQRKQTQSSNVQTSTLQNDERDASNPVIMPTNESMQTKPDTVVSLKQILTDNKIKTDPKLIRRVLRKYHASKINHQHRDAWVFASNDVPNVLTLINTHCRAGKSA